MKLAGDANPNILELLFVSNEHILTMTEAGERLRANRNLFLSQKALHTVSGYAFAQLKLLRPKMELGSCKKALKHAMHLVRLMRMCKEILITCEVVVKRPDREELLAIRNGAWSYYKLI
mgnify:CR=1 FL=1